MPRYNGGFIGHDGPDAPDPPTGVSVSGGTDGVASVSFTAPTDTGTSAITNFVATASSGVGAAGTSSPISVTGLTLGTEVTFRVIAQNAYGYSAPSDVTSAITPAAGVGLFAGGPTASSTSNHIIYITVSTTGNAQDWGDLTVAGGSLGSGGASSGTRGVFGIGENRRSVYDYITFASAGNAVDFGDDSTGNSSGGAGMNGLSNSTRGVWGGVIDSTNKIEYITIANTGNATDFGDLSVKRKACATGASSTRGIWMAGIEGANKNEIDYVTIASTGNATDFGDATVARDQPGGASSSTRMVAGGGQSGSDSTEATIDYITIASTGNATDFGDLVTGRNKVAAVTNTTRAVFTGGGGFGNGNAARQLIDYITIASTGNASDFGDQSTEQYDSASVSSSHGGL